MLYTSKCGPIRWRTERAHIRWGHALRGPNVFPFSYAVSPGSLILRSIFRPTGLPVDHPEVIPSPPQLALRPLSRVIRTLSRHRRTTDSDPICDIGRTEIPQRSRLLIRRHQRRASRRPDRSRSYFGQSCFPQAFEEPLPIGLSFPKIISARSDDAIRTELVW